MNAKRKKVFLGIDTSCYTTSVAAVDEAGRLVGSARRILCVPKGGRGLRQSEMVFAHTKNLPQLMCELNLAEYQIVGIGASIRPRPEADSYMPAFLAGKGLAESLSSVLGSKLITLSHQENHFYAGRWSAQMPELKELLLVHISGGTTEILKVAGGRFEILAATLDISAGQFVDRIGVALGLDFPAGAKLEQLALESNMETALPVAVQKGRISFAGPCSAAMRLLAQGETKHCDLAWAVLHCVAESLFRSIRFAAHQHNLKDVLLVGGVAANLYIKTYLIKKLGKYNIQAFFARPEDSSDNAIGCALYAKDALSNG